jgi:hypothetical protein
MEHRDRDHHARSLSGPTRARDRRFDWMPIGWFPRAVRSRLGLAWLSVVMIYTALLIVYGTAIHPWFMNRGATLEERGMALPGDDITPDPRWQTTRAVTIDASGDVVWAWIIQHGQDRAGFYSYDWLENLIGSNIHNHDSLHAEWQQREVGDSIPMAGVLGRVIGDESKLRVRIVDSKRALVSQAADGGSGAIVVVPISEARTRLLLRDRVGSASEQTGVGSWITDAYRWIGWDPMHYVMQHQMMLGIERRAEGHPTRSAWIDTSSRVGWYAAALLLAAALAFSSGRLWLALPLASMLPALILATDPDAAIAAFMATGITVFGAVRYGRYWWPAWSLLAAAVFLALLLAPDAYLVFGLSMLAATCAISLVWIYDEFRSNEGVRL